MNRRRASLWIPPVAYMVIIFAVSSMSAPAPQVTAFVWDKALHFVEYGALGALLYRAFSGEGFPQGATLLLALGVSSLYAATDEWHQAYVALRESSMNDWLADSVGALVGCFASMALRLPHRLQR